MGVWTQICLAQRLENLVAGHVSQILPTVPTVGCGLCRGRLGSCHFCLPLLSATCAHCLLAPAPATPAGAVRSGKSAEPAGPPWPHLTAAALQSSNFSGLDPSPAPWSAPTAPGMQSGTFAITQLTAPLRGGTGQPSFSFFPFSLHN